MLFGYHIFDLSQREGTQDTPALNVAEAALMQNRGVLAPQPHCQAASTLSTRNAMLTIALCCPPGSPTPCAGVGTALSGA